MLWVFFTFEVVFTSGHVLVFGLSPFLSCLHIWVVFIFEVIYMTLVEFPLQFPMIIGCCLILDLENQMSFFIFILKTENNHI